MFATYVIRTFSVASMALPLLLAGLSLAAYATTGVGGHQPAGPRSAPAGLAPAATAAVTPTAPKSLQIKQLMPNRADRPGSGASVFLAGGLR